MASAGSRKPVSEKSVPSSFQFDGKVYLKLCQLYTKVYVIWGVKLFSSGEILDNLWLDRVMNWLNFWFTCFTREKQPLIIGIVLYRTAEIQSACTYCLSALRLTLSPEYSFSHFCVTGHLLEATLLELDTFSLDASLYHDRHWQHIWWNNPRYFVYN